VALLTPDVGRTGPPESGLAGDRAPDWVAARRLADAGVRVEVRRVPGLPHGFANAANAGRAPRAAMGAVAGALREALPTG
jgi:acetyl esterase/lipase